MAVAGGLLPEAADSPFPDPSLHKSYVKTGDNAYVFVKESMEVAQVVESNHKPQDGWVVATIETGDDAWELGPVPVTVDTWTIVVPRNQPVLIPITHFNALSDAVRTRYIQMDIQQRLVGRSSRRFNLRAIRWPKSNNEVQKSQERYEVVELDQ